MQSTGFIVTIVRHGETFMNQQRLIQGHTDAVLSDKGIEQATLLGRSLVNTTFTKAYASDLQRAYTTAKLLLGQLNTPLEIIKDFKLRERSYGEAEGKPAQEYVQNAAKSNISVQDYVPVGGESIEALGKRAGDFFKDLCTLSDSSSSHENILVVSHGGWIQGLMRYLQSSSKLFELKNFSPSQAIRIHFNTGVTVISIKALQGTEDRKYEVNFLKMNDVSHLQNE